MRAHRGQLGARKMLTGARDQLATIRKQIEATYRDEDLSPDEKRERLDALYGRRNQLSKWAVHQANRFIEAPSYQIGSAG
jgi:hypothetical protein